MMLTIHHPLRFRLAALVAVAALVVAACGSDGDNTIRLGSGGELTPGSVDASGVGEAVEGKPVAFTYGAFNGERERFSDLTDGKPVVVNFFASWCPTCIAEMPDFETVYQNVNADVEFLGLAMQDRVESAEELVEQTGISYPVGTDQQGEVFALFGGLGMPTTVFIDGDGAVAKVHSGQLDDTALADLIDEHLMNGPTS